MEIEKFTFLLIMEIHLHFPRAETHSDIRTIDVIDNIFLVGSDGETASSTK